MTIRITFLPDEQVEERRVFILRNQGSGDRALEVDEITNHAYLDYDGDDTEIVVSENADTSLTLRTETWYCSAGYCQVTMNVLSLEGAIRSFVALMVQADQEEWS